MGSPTALSGFELAVVSSVPAPACGGAAKHTQSPVASTNAERPLAFLIIGNLPILPRPGSARRTQGVSAARQKKGIFARVRAKTGHWQQGIGIVSASISRQFVREIFLE